VAAEEFNVVARQRDGAVTLSGGVPSLAPSDVTAWLAQAIRLRDQAFRLAQARFAVDSEARRLESYVDLGPAEFRAEDTASLTADYLVENEKMIDLMSVLVREGLLAAPSK
jgi:fructose-1-phosphate kinase PfkB-like protein